MLCFYCGLFFLKTKDFVKFRILNVICNNRTFQCANIFVSVYGGSISGPKIEMILPVVQPLRYGLGYFRSPNTNIVKYTNGIRLV